MVYTIVATDDRLCNYVIDHQSLLPLVTDDRKDFYSRLIRKFYF